MNFDISGTLDSVKDEIKEFAEDAHEKISSLDEKYVSKVLPDCGKYGDQLKFLAELVPGVAEYNAIKDGDWVAFAISAGIDIAALTAGIFTLGAGFTAAKSGGVIAKASVKKAAKEIAEAGAKTVVKETGENIIKKTAKEGAEKVAKEAFETGAEKVTKEAFETGAEKVTKEVAEESAKKITQKATEKGVESLDIIEKQITKNTLDGTAREEKVLDDLIKKYGDENVIREALLRDKDGIPIKDPTTDEARRIDFVVTKFNKIFKSIEVTSETADKTLQIQKQARIMEEAAKRGGAFIKDKSGKLIEFTMDIITEIRRLP